MSRWRRTLLTTLVTTSVAVAGLQITRAEEPEPVGEETQRLVADMGRLPLDDHVGVISRLQTRLRSKLLTPSDEVVRRFASITGVD